MLGGFVLSSASETAPKMELGWLKHVKLPKNDQLQGFAGPKHLSSIPNWYQHWGRIKINGGIAKFSPKSETNLNPQHQMPIASSGFQKLF